MGDLKFRKLYRTWILCLICRKFYPERWEIKNINEVDHIDVVTIKLALYLTFLQEIVYNKAAMFLDSKYIVSTGAGLPLALSVTGTAMVHLKLYGSLISTKFSKENELQLDLKANVEPTVSLDITGEMAVDAFFASTGIKLKANMFTDTAVESDIKIRGSRLVSAKFSLPKRNNEIIHAR